MTWREEDHPRDDGGRFTNGGRYYPTNSLEPYIPSYTRKKKRNQLTKSQYARWSKMLADGLHGDYILESDGKKHIRLDNLIIISSGSFETPHIERVRRFKNEDYAIDFFNKLAKKGKKNAK